MKRRMLAAALVLLLSLALRPSAHGQTLYGGGMYPSPVSPYVNLNRLGAPAGVNYFNIVQPQIQFQSQIGQLQQSTNMLQSAMTGAAGSTNGVFTSGHTTYFGNTSHYFPVRRGMSGMGSTGGMGMAMSGGGGGGMGLGMGMGGGRGIGGLGGLGSLSGGGSMGFGGMSGMMQNFPGRMGRPPMGFQGGQVR